MGKTYRKNPKIWFDEEDFSDEEVADKKPSKAEAKKQRQAEALRMMIENGLA